MTGHPIRFIGVIGSNGGGPDWVGTKEAARQIGIDRSTLHGWWKAGRCKPDWVTPGGHARWDVEKLKRQLGISPYREG